MSLELSSRIYQGWVRHRRFTPTRHDFRYKTLYLWLNLQEIDKLFSFSPLWSIEKPNLVSFKRKDYLPDYPHMGLDDAIRAKIKSLSGNDFSGDIFMLAHLRYWNICFNPVVFYFAYDKNRLNYILADINNTPWDEHHAYLLQTQLAPETNSDQVVLASQKNSTDYGFNFGKRFHVSPFMPMDIEYQWHFHERHLSRVVHMNLIKNSNKLFDATLNLTELAITESLLNRLPFHYGGTTLKVLSGIYWQAFQLWLKKTPFYDHPSSIGT